MASFSCAWRRSACLCWSAGWRPAFWSKNFRLFGYGAQLPEPVRQELHKFDEQSRSQRTRQETLRLIAQGIIGVWLIAALALHLAEVGLIGLSVIILATTFTGVTDEHAIGKAFTEALPFTALLAVFFAVVAVIIDQHLFAPIIAFVLQASPDAQLTLFYLFNGLLSSISDNVFVGTVYINEAKAAMEQGSYQHRTVRAAGGGHQHRNKPAVRCTPNGQAAFLFLLTSALAPLIRLSYGRMVWMALPYTLVLTDRWFAVRQNYPRSLYAMAATSGYTCGALKFAAR